MRAARKPDIEFRRQLAPGTYRSYGHIYWRPLIVHLLGRTLVGKRHLRRQSPRDDQDEA